ncbi:Alpha/Beta hydrolase protein [Xylariomycetidae sp. FL0641]|nr:Alpha/Beta hydrolase protein [Xylariomycetidae sp. FL0641]
MPEDQFVTLPSGCRICYHVFGALTDPAILIVSGGSTAMTQKTDAHFVRLLLRPPGSPHPLCVVRFDHRDTGRSSAYPRRDDDDGEPAYGLEAMVGDAVGLIGHLGLTRVHLVGMSLGGPIAWLAAARLPGVVRSLALFLTSPVGRQPEPGDALPPVKSEGRDLLADAFALPADLGDDEEAWVDGYSRLDLALAAVAPTDEDRAVSRNQSEVTYRREKDSGTLWTRWNHAGASGGRWPRETLRRIRCPTVVVAAAGDQIFPIEHARALRDDVAGATLVVLEDCGHEMPRRIQPRLAEAILENVGRAERSG